ncbi:MAG: tetratricopeptide repeat protein [Azospirillaceae bacterium]|nr:tetratricopeptide repeat protein [Azospirillaceae bacterium]
MGSAEDGDSAAGAALAALYRGAWRAHRDGDRVTARQGYVAVLARDPDHADALDMLGMLCFQEGDCDRALDLLDRARSRKPRDPAILRHQGVVLMALGRFGDAVAPLTAALALEPDDPETQFNRGVVARQLGDSDRAVALLVRATQALPGAAMVVYQLALALQAAGNTKRAVRCYRRTIALEPGNAAAYNNIGMLLHDGGEVSGAVSAYRRALVCQPDLLAALNNAAAGLMEQDALAAAAALIDRAQTLDPANADGCCQRGVWFQRGGDRDSATVWFRRAVQCDPLHAAAHSHLARVLHEAGGGDAALESYRAVVRRWPDDFRAQALLADALENAGAFDEAVAAYRRVLALRGDDDATHQKVGIVLTMREPAQPALIAAGIVHLRQSLALHPDCAPYWGGLALALLRQGDGAASVAACDRWLLLSPHEQEAIAYRAIGLRLAGRIAAADSLVDPAAARVHVARLASPLPGVELAEFNRGLADELRAMGSRQWQPDYQSIRGGTQTPNNLFSLPQSSIQALATAIDRHIRAALPSLVAGDPKHAFAAGLPRRYAYRSWSVVLEDHGFHIPHIHHQGWLSGCYYVAVPDFIDNGDPDQGGLELGRPWIDFPFVIPPPRRVVPAVAGQLVLFPSYYWHETRPFHSTGQRITVAFDLLPVER